jgi:6-pyruvoyltetrahydropterin/6-carboxytetrahydropterin synthase
MSPNPEFSVLLAKEDFKFSAAHFTLFPDGSAELLHGHNYQVSVELTGCGLDGHGMLCDFVHTKKAIRELCQGLDSRTLIPVGSADLEVRRDGDAVEVAYQDRRYRLPAADVLLLELPNTTIELFAAMIWQQLMPELANQGLIGLAVSVAETAGQSCWYRAPFPATPRGDGLRGSAG